MRSSTILRLKKILEYTLTIALGIFETIREKEETTPRERERERARESESETVSVCVIVL